MEITGITEFLADLWPHTAIQSPAEVSTLFREGMQGLYRELAVALPVWEATRVGRRDLLVWAEYRVAQRVAAGTSEDHRMVRLPVDTAVAGMPAVVAAEVIDSAQETSGSTARSPSFGRAHFFIFSGTIADTMQTTIRTLDELGIEASRFVRSLVLGEHATLVTLSGELGAGKTALTKEIAKTLGVEETVTSPTFVLEKIYSLEGQQFKRLVHIDAYRLEEGESLDPLGFDELIQDAGNLILLEWPEKVTGVLPTPTMKVSLVSNPDGSRTLTYG